MQDWYLGTLMGTILVHPHLGIVCYLTPTKNARKCALFGKFWDKNSGILAPSWRTTERKKENFRPYTSERIPKTLEPTRTPTMNSACAVARIPARTPNFIPLQQLYLKIPSGQIGSAWEGYHWIGVDKNIDLYRFFLFFYFSFDYLKGLPNSEPLHTKMNPNPLPFGWRTFICRKNPPKDCRILVWIAGCWNSSNILLPSRNSKSNCWLSGIFGAWFGG